MLSGLLSVVGSLCAFTFLRAFPKILRSRGWFGVHASLATFAAVSAFAMGAIMFSDSRKFARGTIPGRRMRSASMYSHLRLC